MKVTLSIIAVCIIVLILQASIKGFTGMFALTPNLAFSGQIWQFVTYMFLHGDFMHLFLNMLGLIIFGTAVENTIGRKKYVFLFFVSGIGSAVLYILITGLFTPAALVGEAFSVPMLGASGAVFGVMAGYGLLYPRNWIIMFPGIPMPAIVAVGVFAGIEIFFGLTGLQPGIANWGHLGGLVIGALLIFHWKRKHSKPKLIVDELEEAENKDWKFVWE